MLHKNQTAKRREEAQLPLCSLTAFSDVLYVSSTCAPIRQWESCDFRRRRLDEWKPEEHFRPGSLTTKSLKEPLSSSLASSGLPEQNKARLFPNRHEWQCSQTKTHGDPACHENSFSHCELSGTGLSFFSLKGSPLASKELKRLKILLSSICIIAMRKAWWFCYWTE